MKLYELEWGLYPRRVGIYLAEKSIADIERIAFDAMVAWPLPEIAALNPAGTVPVLRTEAGVLIRASIAILEYLEERFPSPTMLGATPEERARTREFVSIIDEAANQFGIWCHKASPLFAAHEMQNREAATFAADAYHSKLRVTDRLIPETAGPFLTGSHVTIADCMAMATLQFAEQVYSVVLPDDCGNLIDWYRAFARRPSAALPPYPEPVLALTRNLPAHCAPTCAASMQPEAAVARD